MERMKKAGIIARGRIDCFTERAAGLAVLEEAVLDARGQIRAALTDFDPDLPLVSPRGRRIGRSWFDLILHTLVRGVSVSLTLGDAGRAGMLAALMQRVDAEPQARRRRGALSLQASGRPGGHPSCRMNVAAVDDKVLFVARQGLVPGAARDLTMIAHGPVVAEGVNFLASHAQICAGTAEAAPARRLLRTLSRPAHGIGSLLGPKTIANEIESAHHMLIRRAARLIYIETQRFDSPAFAEHLARRAGVAPDLNLILILPGPPEGRRAVQGVRLLGRSFGPRFLLGLASGGCTNVSVFDDQLAIGGSADLDLWGLRVDAGVSLYLRASDGVAALRQRLAQHWIPGIAAGAGAAEWRKTLQETVSPLLRPL
ncbi:hypothetical protein [Paenirhodobacter sp.]|uniref:hypothetical protein n=1 Tax=Paenirhodobacter sp. TaxID=1965326 RepID=UPI003B3DEB62